MALLSRIFTRLRLRTDELHVRTAICGFDDWRHPWRFHEAVTTSLDPSDAELFQHVWREATDASHWSESDLSACAKRAESHLRSRFPFLGSKAARAVANGAAYEWR